ncbi:MAG: pilus assembly protein [Anaerolineae bacterium]|nr:pilus assembly protein [Anaerolineae bacterium]
MMKRKKQKGQGLVEFALILPVMLLVIVGTMEFGRIFLIYATVSNGAREGARYGMVSPTDIDGIIARVNDTMVMTLPENLLVAVSYDTGPDGIPYTNPDDVTVGDRVIVEVQYQIYALTPIFEPFIPDDFMVDVLNTRTIQSVKLAMTPTVMPPPPTDEFGNTLTPTPTEEPTEEPTGEPTGEPTDEFGNTLTPTPGTPTATATPVPMAPIIINKPLWENDTAVIGTAEPNQVLTLRIVQTGYQLSGIVDAGGNFAFTGLPALVGGHTVIVQGYGTQDLAVVQVPTPTPTPIATPSDPYIFLDPACTDEQFVTIHVTWGNWSPSAKTMFIYWGDDLVTPVCSGNISAGETGCYFDAYVADGSTNTVTGIAKKDNGSEVGRDTETFTRPCTPPTPTPTPSADLPDLQISGISLQNPLPWGTYERLYVTVGVHNAGDTMVSSLFWVDLYADPTGVLTTQGSVDYVAINAIAAGSTVSFTMYVPDGFKEVGNHTLQAMVDTWDQIIETDETNNISALLPVTLTVSNPAPIPTATPVGTTPPPGDIQGVTYLNGPPQSNVSIYIFAEDGRMVGSGRSDADGNYLITNVPEGTYTVVGELRLADTLYYGQVTEVTVVAGQTTTGVNIDLVVVP